jgi:hypothetical protein
METIKHLKIIKTLNNVLYNDVSMIILSYLSIDIYNLFNITRSSVYVNDNQISWYALIHENDFRILQNRIVDTLFNDCDWENLKSGILSSHKNLTQSLEILKNLTNDGIVDSIKANTHLEEIESDKETIFNAVKLMNLFMFNRLLYQSSFVTLLSDKFVYRKITLFKENYSTYLARKTIKLCSQM